MNTPNHYYSIPLLALFILSLTSSELPAQNKRSFATPAAHSPSLDTEVKAVKEHVFEVLPFRFLYLPLQRKYEARVESQVDGLENEEELSIHLNSVAGDHGSLEILKEEDSMARSSIADCQFSYRVDTEGLLVLMLSLPKGGSPLSVLGEEALTVHLRVPDSTPFPVNAPFLDRLTQQDSLIE